jgi:dTDP-4-dehydrorhamnose reductase
MEKKYFKPQQAPELWGGIECSYNRVRSRYFDQLQYCRHYDHIESDIECFARLGIRAMRYPVIWERHRPKLNAQINWLQAEAAISSMKQHAIEPIVGLVHHGSGPKYADISKSGFANQLSQFAGTVAERFPYLNFYTPVNEPLTTARFCGLYGLWYPHKKNNQAFVRTFLNQLKGIVLSMQEIRKVNPHAQLVQTEDLAKIFSTPVLGYQAEFENHRRWLTFDTLCGILKPGHALWEYFMKYAESENDLRFFIDNPCPPDLIGLDYYPTSERYLDGNFEKYPVEKHGHNHRHRYADVEAIRVRHKFPSGPEVLLKEVWDRYHIPMSVTEVHIHCDCDNQIRWFSRIWNSCCKLIAEGVDIRAVTTWAILGSFGWNTLLTQPDGLYESGAFDISSGKRTETALAAFLIELSKNSFCDHVALSHTGWWEDESRYLFDHHTAADLTARDHPVQYPVLRKECVEK